MANKFPNLFSPGRIGTLELKNRIVKAPQSTGLSNMDGTVSERLIRHYRELARGGAALIIVEYAYVDNIASKSAHCQLGISSNEHIPGLAWLASVIKENGAKAGIQIEHCGRQKFLGTPPIKSASRIPWPKLYDRVGIAAVPEELTIEEIQQIVEAFGDAARRAVDA
ncbi:MAG: NADH oxidase, partial [Thermacetogeniaceae bacterium]